MFVVVVVDPVPSFNRSRTGTIRRTFVYIFCLINIHALVSY